MTEVLKFDLSGQFAHFRRPEYNKLVNNKAANKKGHPSFTFSHIPKTHLLGIFGSILGLDSFMKGFEYYYKLRHLKIAIVPDKVVFKIFDHSFMDHTGLVEGNRARPMLFYEQLLVNPKWTIYVLNDNSSEYKQLKSSILNSKGLNHIYLGRGELFGNIDNIEITEAEKHIQVEGNFCIESLFFTEEDLIARKDVLRVKGGEPPFMYKEFLPVGFENNKNKYLYKNFYFTNQSLRTDKIDFDRLYLLENKILFFF